MQGCCAQCADDHSHEHARLHSFAGNVAHNDEDRSREIAWKHLEEVATYFARRSVLAIDGEPGNLSQLIGNQDLLNVLSLLDFELPLLLLLL